MKKLFVTTILFALMISGCGQKNQQADGDEITITLGAYTVPKEVYQKEIIPAFQQYWLERTGKRVKFAESYIASGAQSRAIEAGFEADIAALSLEKDVTRLQDAGLITHKWKDRKFNGFVTRSVVVIVFREGNPKNIRDWQDLTKSGVSVIYPSPKTSGGAMWDINAIYGAGLKLSEIQKDQKDETFACNLLKSIQKNVKVMNKSGRAAVTTFESGVGDAMLTYENEVLLRGQQGRDMDFIIPDATILIENPIAVIDANVEKHNNREAVEAFVEFMLTPESQRAFARYGFRPVDETVAQEFVDQYPAPEHLFDIEYLGGWDKVSATIYGNNGIWTKIMEELAHEK